MATPASATRGYHPGSMALTLQSRNLAIFNLDYGLVDAGNLKLALHSLGACYDRTYSRTISWQTVTTLAFRYHYEFTTLRAISDWPMGPNGQHCENIGAAEVVVVHTAEEALDGFRGIR